MPRKKSIVNLL